MMMMMIINETPVNMLLFFFLNKTVETLSNSLEISEYESLSARMMMMRMLDINIYIYETPVNILLFGFEQNCRNSLSLSLRNLVIRTLLLRGTEGDRS